MTTLDRIAEVIHDFFDDDSINVTPELSAPDVALWDSLNHIRLMVAIEAEFGIELKTEDITNLKNIGALAEIIDSK